MGDAALSLTGRHPYRNPPPGSSLYFGVITFKLIERTIMQKMVRMLRRDWYQTDWSNMVIRIIKGPGIGNKLFFVSADADVKTWESFSAWKFYLDEELPEAYVEAAFTRVLDNDGQILWGMTLEQGLTWSYHKYLVPWLEKKNHDYCDVIRGTTWDNPFHDPDVVTREYERERMVNPTVAEVRYKGAWIDLTGAPFFGPTAMDRLEREAEKAVWRRGSFRED